MKITSVETIALRDDSDGTVISWNPSFSESDGVPASTGGYDITLVQLTLWIVTPRPLVINPSI